MQRLKILYLGSAAGTSRHRALALERLGHAVRAIDPHNLLPHYAAIDRWVHHTGGVAVDRRVTEQLREKVRGEVWDLLWVDGGVLLERALIRDLQGRSRLAINYNIDDPFGGRDGQKWRNYFRTLDLYNLVVVVRECNVREARAWGARNVLRVTMSADECAHAPVGLTPEDRAEWESEVLFAGTWMPERGPFLARLIELGVPLTIVGDRWEKAKEWQTLRPHWRGRGIYQDSQYARAVQTAKVCLGLLSKGNRDLSTTRSFEIPHLNGLLCAERTAEHARLYREGEEALFWSSPEECAAQCLWALANDEFRLRISAAGRARCLANQTTNEPVLRRILDTVLCQTHGLGRLAS